MKLRDNYPNSSCEVSQIIVYFCYSPIFISSMWPELTGAITSYLSFLWSAWSWLFSWFALCEEDEGKNEGKNCRHEATSGSVFDWLDVKDGIVFVKFVGSILDWFNFKDGVVSVILIASIFGWLDCKDGDVSVILIGPIFGWLDCKDIASVLLTLLASVRLVELTVESDWLVNNVFLQC